jgi:IS5 family transposase
MSRRDLCQPSFVEAMVSGCGKVGGFLDRIEQGFGWSAFEALLSPIHGSAMGAPGYPPLTMFKILLLQQWHTLSDPAAEEAVRDRLSFRRFCGLPLDVETPDHASIWRFRQAIDKLGLSRKLLGEVNRQLDAHGLRHQARHAGRRDHHRRCGEAPLTCAAASIRATPRRVSRASATRPISAPKRIWRWTRRAGWRPGRDDPGQCARQSSGRSADPGRRAGLFRRHRAYDSQALRETLERRGLVDGIAWKVKHPAIPSRPGKSSPTPGRGACAQRWSAPSPR